MSMSYRILMVCMGNICRSPTAQGLLEKQLALHQLTEQVTVDSAGTHGYHLNCPPDQRSIAAAKAAGIDISGQLSRKVVVDDFRQFDEILVMDQANLAALASIQPGDTKAVLRLIMTDLPTYGFTEVPDPYYGGDAGFVQVVDMLDQVCAAICRRLTNALSHQQ